MQPAVRQRKGYALETGVEGCSLSLLEASGLLFNGLVGFITAAIFTPLAPLCTFVISGIVLAGLMCRIGYPVTRRSFRASCLVAFLCVFCEKDKLTGDQRFAIW